jgi:cytochrome c oxidase assembly protein subunit 15
MGPGRLGVHALAWVTLLATLVLISSGGLVTSKGVGMAVPDWPTTYGYNMFLYPVSKWVGGIFYEHTHRLLGSLVGFFMVLLAVGLFIAEPRRWVKMLAAIAVLGVVLQGVLGGLRVTLYKDEIGIFHGILAQLFLCTVATLVLATSPMFVKGRFVSSKEPGLLRWGLTALSALILVQLAVGASMRHAHSWLAIPDFPLAYGQVWPDTSAETVASINKERLAQFQPPTSAAQIILQMKHRLMAVAILLGVGWVAWRALRSTDGRFGLLATLWFLLVLGQAGLGAWTIWSGKSDYVATAHVVVGALCLLFGVILAERQFFSHAAKRRLAAVVEPASPSTTLAPARELVTS